MLTRFAILTVSSLVALTSTRISFASYSTTFDDVTASNMYRNPQTPQMSITTERSTAKYALGYHEVPNILTDDDGYFTPAHGCTATGGAQDTCTQMIYASRPSVDCGLSGPVTLRIANCSSLNGSHAIWNNNGTQSTGGESTWKLVTRKNGFEVWRDERTQFLWSDNLGYAYDWCQASGNFQSDDPSGLCSSSRYQNQTAPMSACTEFAGSQPAFAGENYSTGVYSDAKGGMGAKSATAVRWRLPTRNDFLQAEVDGLRFVLPNLAGFWTATLSSHDRSYPWIYDARDADTILIDGAPIGSPQTMVRCMGRYVDTSGSCGNNTF